MTQGERIKAARKAAGLTQEELAKRLGVPFQSISQWERDKRLPKYETLEKIAAAIGCDIMDLIYDETPSIYKFEIDSGKLAKAVQSSLEGDEIEEAIKMLNAKGRAKLLLFLKKLTKDKAYVRRGK